MYLVQQENGDGIYFVKFYLIYTAMTARLEPSKKLKHSPKHVCPSYWHRHLLSHPRIPALVEAVAVVLNAVAKVALPSTQLEEVADAAGA